MAGFEWKCPRCERTVRRFEIVPPVTCVCGLSDKELKHVTYLPDWVKKPKKIEQAIHYSTAIGKWYAAGKPVRPDAEILQIHTNCCTPCKYFVDSMCTHKACGCAVLTPEEERQSLATLILPGAMVNKLRMATEDCPLKCGRCKHSKWKHVSGKCSECNCTELVK